MLVYVIIYDMDMNNYDAVEENINVAGENDNNIRLF